MIKCGENNEGGKYMQIDWNNLGFSYIKTPWRFIAKWKDGQWEEGELTEDNYLTIHHTTVLLLVLLPFHYKIHEDCYCDKSHRLEK